MSKKCLGCGSILQIKSNKQQGFIPENKYQEANYCERCFRITHYNEQKVTKLENINTYILKEINKSAKFVYFLIDFLNINEETINTYKSILVPKILIISKLDIIPKSIKDNVITSWLEKTYGITESIFCQSTKKNYNTKSLIKHLENIDKKESYILGYTNAGKSTLINKLSVLNNITDKQITTSLIPNTTIDFIKIKLTDTITLIDSPGFTLENTLYKEDEFNLINKVNPKKFLKPVTYQVKEISSILIEDKIRIKSSTKNSLTFYMSNNLVIKRVFNNNLNLLQEKKIELDIPENHDLVIKSVGFINIKQPCKLTIYCHNTDLFEVRKSMFRD